jgi:hypothetical protein
MATPLLLTTPLLLPTGPRIAQQLSGSLQGTLIDATGKAVSNAIVYALPEQQSRRQIRTTTDPQGRFVFKALPEGVVYLDAFGKSDGFPFNFFAFFNHSSPISKVEVKAGVMPDIVISLEHKTARIAINLTDQSGTPLERPMALSFTRDDMDGVYRQSATAPYSMLVPCVPFSFSLQVEEYQPWCAERMTIQPGEILDIAVKLQAL